MAIQVVHAQRYLYQSDSGGPFIRMMLSMMDAMGMIDRFPNNGLYGGYGNNMASPWSNYSNPYSRALALRGIYPGTTSQYGNPYSNNLLGNSPFLRSPWLQSPWLNSGGYGSYGSPFASPLWGSPDWGVLPEEKFSPYGYSSYGKLWSETDLDGWVDEPWENSEWNPKANKSDGSSQQQQTHQQRQTMQSAQSSQPQPPVIQNFNITVPDTVQPGSGQDNYSDSGQAGRHADEYNNSKPGVSGNRSPLARLAQPRPQMQQSARPPGQQRKPSPLRKRTPPPPYQQAQQQRQWQGPQAQSNQLSRSQQSRPQQQHSPLPRNQVRERPCISEFCGLKKPNLNGLWVAQDGEMLGISGEKFLWADTNERYLAGLIKIENEYLLASVEDSDRLLRFKYKIAGDHLLTMQPNGTIREFIRTTPGELYGSYYSGY
ncbi:MAG: hypothetical protein KJN89_11390 [Gammaproteobacteria bacterium]|nr:hypothetical protein [Gammaproteobacteria bacterium]MBT8134406.1 hypothetical protein [Gammaproteobacteria bacterium]NNJ50969.1 hypothetical protein [Gammaproteobacteria bacterium]